MTRMFLLAGLLAALSACVGATDKAPHGTVSGIEDIALPIPGGDCALSDRHPADRDMLLLAELIHAGRNRVLSVFADCQDVADFRAGGAEPARRTSYLMPLSARDRHINLPRGQVIADLTAQADRADPHAAAGRDIQRRFDQAGFGRNLGEVVSLGVLHSDDTALYMGTVQNVGDSHGITLRAVTVNALTLINGRLLGVSLGAPYQGPESVERILADAQGHVGRLIAAN